MRGARGPLPAEGIGWRRDQARHEIWRVVGRGGVMKRAADG